MDGGVLYVGFVTIGVVIASFHNLGCKMQVLPQFKGDLYKLKPKRITTS